MIRWLANVLAQVVESEPCTVDAQAGRPRRRTGRLKRDIRAARSCLSAQTVQAASCCGRVDIAAIVAAGQAAGYSDRPVD